MITRRESEGFYLLFPSLGFPGEVSPSSRLFYRVELNWRKLDGGPRKPTATLVAADGVNAQAPWSS